MPNIEGEIQAKYNEYYEKTGKQPNSLILSNLAMSCLKVQLSRLASIPPQSNITQYMGMDITLLEDENEQVIVRVGNTL